MEETKFQAQNAIEAAEQVRAAYTVSRFAYAALALLSNLTKKSETYNKKLVKIHKDYYDLLLKSYDDYLKLYEELKEKEGANE